MPRWTAVDPLRSAKSLWQIRGSFKLDTQFLRSPGGYPFLSHAPRGRDERPLADMELRRLVSDRLRQLRRDRGYTQGETAHRAGVSEDVVGMIERAETTPSLETLHRLCQALRLSLAEFLTFPDDTQAESVAEELQRYLVHKRPEHVRFADRLVRTAIEMLEAEGPSQAGTSQ